jgi:hypothetical protein
LVFIRGAESSRVRKRAFEEIFGKLLYRENVLEKSLRLAKFLETIRCEKKFPFTVDSASLLFIYFVGYLFEDFF